MIGGISDTDLTKAMNTANPKGRTLDGLINLTSKLGYGADNQMSQGYYSMGSFISRRRTELEAIYRTSWSLGKIVNIIAQDMTRGKAEIQTDDLQPDQIAQMYRAMGRLRIWHDLCNCLKWARLFGGGLAIMMIDGQKAETPLNIDTIRPGQFKGLLVLDRWLVNPTLGDVVTDMGVNLGMPMYYEIIGDAAGLPGLKVHHSRVIRFDGLEMPYYQKKYENSWGISVVEPMYDIAMAFDSLILGAGQLVFKAHLRGIGVDGLRQALSIGGKAEEAVIKQFEYIRMMQTNEGLTLLDAKDTFWTQAYSFSGLPEMIVQFEQQFAGAGDIPLVRFFGMSPAGLNSTGESDLRNHYDHIKEEQESQLRAPLEEKLFPVLCRSVLGIPWPENATIEFNSLWQMTDKEKADMAKVDIDGVNELYNSGLLTQKMALTELKQGAKVHGRFSNITDEDIERADDELKPKDEMFGGPGLPGFEGKQSPTKDADFVESEHPRDEEGKFSESGEGAVAKQPVTQKKSVPSSWHDLDVNSQAKYKRIAHLNTQFESVKEQNDSKAHKDERAACLKLIISTGIRPGSDKDTHAKKKAYGATTLEGRHVVEENGIIYLRYVGKKGVDLNIPVHDKEVASMLLKRKKVAGENGKIFDTRADKLSEYTHSLDGGEFKTKDFRTHLGTVTAINIIKSENPPKTEQEYRKKVMLVAKMVSAKLGNTPVVALQAYINPLVFSGWRKAI